MKICSKTKGLILMRVSEEIYWLFLYFRALKL